MASLKYEAPKTLNTHTIAYISEESRLLLAAPISGRATRDPVLPCDPTLCMLFCHQPQDRRKQLHTLCQSQAWVNSEGLHRERHPAYDFCQIKHANISEESKESNTVYCLQIQKKNNKLKLW